MYSTFLAACLAGVGLSLQIESTLQLPDTSPVFNLAQTSNVSANICQRTADRNKAALPDFYSLYAGSTAFSDTSFAHTSKDVFAWADAKETDTVSSSNIVWKRASDVFSDHTLFGSNGVTPQDMRQGAIGNCWFVSAASALSEVPGRVEKLFLNANNEVSKAGIYAVNLYTLGVPHTVVVDDWLPLQTWGTGYAGVYAKPSEDKAIYGPILEKAFAKYHGNYSHIIGGDAKVALKTLYNAPYSSYKHASVTDDALWKVLEDADKNKDIIQTHTSGSNDSK